MGTEAPHARARVQSTPPFPRAAVLGGSVSEEHPAHGSLQMFLSVTLRHHSPPDPGQPLAPVEMPSLSVALLPLKGRWPWELAAGHFSQLKELEFFVSSIFPGTG